MLGATALSFFAFVESSRPAGRAAGAPHARGGHPHFCAPTAVPVLGALVSLVLAGPGWSWPVLAGPLADRDAGIYVRAGVLVALGVALWAVNKAALRACGELCGRGSCC